MSPLHYGAMAPPPTGQQFEISRGDQRATVVEVGGGIRAYHLGDWAVLDGYARDARCDGGRGQPLLPWPNRLEDGRYTFAGRELRLPVDEFERSNAIHGLARWSNWSALDQRPDRVALGLTLYPRPGYPFTLEVRLEYALDEAGLRVRTTATNVGTEALPFGVGYHPYLSVGSARIDEDELRLPARQSLVTNERMLPTGDVVDVAGTDLDFRAGRRIGPLQLDACFTGLERDAGGRATVELRGPDGRRVDLWLDRAYDWLMVFTGDTLAPARRRQGLAVEPMSCPANAFRTGVGLRVLQPGEAFAGTWGIVPHRRA